MTTARTAAEVLERDFLEIRARILEVAAALDRIDRAAGPSVAADPRMQKIRQALQALETADATRAEQVQLLFSLGYDQNWRQTLNV